MVLYVASTKREKEKEKRMTEIETGMVQWPCPQSLCPPYSQILPYTHEHVLAVDVMVI